MGARCTSMIEQNIDSVPKRNLSSKVPATENLDKQHD
jgi:hypothetical protein